MIIDKIIKSLLSLGVNVKTISPKQLLIICGLVSLLLVNCAYYNTFYNAQKYYREGVSKQKTNPSAAKSSFDKAIEKSALVISNYPRSQYTAEALFIIGMSYYYNKEYVKAISKFENLLLVFPNSEFIDEANLYWAICLIQTLEYDLALQKLQTISQTVARNKLPKPLAEIASYSTAKIYFDKNDYEQAEIELKSFIAQYPKSTHQKDALLILGDAQRATKKYNEAIISYETYLKKLDAKLTVTEADTSTERTKGILRLAQCLIECERTVEGMQILDKITRADTAGSKQVRLDAKSYLELGKAFLKINDVERTRDFLKKVKAAPEIIEAFYLLGNSYESESKFDTAKAYYDSVVARKISNETTTLAQSRLELLKLVVSLPSIEINKKDTITSKKDSLIKKADIIKKQPEITIDTTQLDSLVFPEDTLYSELIDTLRPLLQDTVKSVSKDTMKPQIKKDTLPLSKPNQTEPADSSAVQFHLAEIYNLNLKNYERALAEYEKVYQKYPKSSYAPKALFAQVWIYKNIFKADTLTNRFHTEFNAVLNKIIAEYPNTDYAKAAQDIKKQ